MKIPKVVGLRAWPHAEIEQAASKDSTPLTEPYLRREGKQAFLCATDSYIMARIPVEADGEADGYVPAEALKAARKPDCRLRLTAGKVIVEHPNRRLEIIRSDLGEFPNISHLIPERRADFSVVVDITLLLRAAKALGARAVRLSFAANDDGSPKNLTPIIVEPGMPMDGRIALVMPIRSPGEDA